MRNVFVVTEGTYSDYRIKAVFSTEEKAEKYKSKFYHCNEVETYELDSEESEVADKIVVNMEPDGSSSDFHDADRKTGFQFFNLYNTSFQWVVETSSEERAIKVVNEKRAQIIALNLWGDDEKVRELFSK